MRDIDHKDADEQRGPKRASVIRASFDKEPVRTSPFSSWPSMSVSTREAICGDNDFTEMVQIISYRLDGDLLAALSKTAEYQTMRLRWC